MAESKKGTSAPADSKESSSFDGDFGKDFLSSWKSSKTGKDQINFDVESAPRNKQKTFNFDKLDDFELGGDFDKLSSFKMDMSDLDFSSPLKKTEKTKGNFSEETVPGKKDAKQDKFSFTFNFNETCLTMLLPCPMSLLELRLDNFDLDSNLLKGEEKTKKCIDDVGPDCSTKHDKGKDTKFSMQAENQESVIHDMSQHPRSNSAIITHVSEDNETKRFPVLESREISRSEHLIDPKNADCAGPSTSDRGCQDVSRETVTSMEKQMNLVGENEKAIHNKGGNKQQTDGSCFLKKYSGNALPKFSVLSVSGDSSAQEALPQIKKGPASLDHAKADSPRELGDTARSNSSSHSQNSSLANSYNSKCWRRASSTESPISTGDSEKVQGNPSGATNGSTVPSESAKCQQDVDNVCVTNFTQNYASPSKFSSDKQNSCPKLLPSPLHRGSMLVKSMSVNEKAVTTLQLNPLSKTEPQLTPAPTAKQLFSVDSGKRKSLTPCPGYANRESIQNAEVEVGDQKSQDKSSSKEICLILGSGENDKSDPSHAQLPPSSLPGQITATSSVKNILPNPFSATATKKSSQNISVEKQDIPLKDGKKHYIPSLKLSGITESNIKTSNFTMQKETRPVRFMERKLEVPLSTVSRISSSGSAKKFVLPSPSLKRKMLEESKTDPESLNPLKRVMESTTQRRGSLEVSPTINKKLEVSSTVDKNMVLGTGNPEAYQGNVSMDSIAYSNYAPEMKNVADIELPVLIENDGNVEKAEACAKELDDICNMLRKKNEEAKELLVRSVVNNNALMLLNHPMYDEKIRALQKRFASLQSREL